MGQKWLVRDSPTQITLQWSSWCVCVRVDSHLAPLPSERISPSALQLQKGQMSICGCGVESPIFPGTLDHSACVNHLTPQLLQQVRGGQKGYTVLGGKWDSLRAVL
jgi:hypothetical protein